MAKEPKWWPEPVTPDPYGRDDSMTWRAVALWLAIGAVATALVFVTVLAIGSAGRAFG